MEPQNRILWIDTIKAICMALIFYAHSQIYVTGDLTDCFYIPFYVNAYFVVSGYLFFLQHPHGVQPSLRKDCMRWFARLWVPMTLFSTLLFIPKFLFHQYTITLREFLYSILGGTAYWFLAALCVVQFIFILYQRYFFRSTLFIIFFLSLAAAFLSIYIHQPYNAFPYCYPSALLAMFYFAAGGLLQRYEHRIKRYLTTPLLLGLFLLYLFILGTNHVDVYGGYKWLLSLLIIPVLYAIAHYLPSYRWVRYISTNSLGFYLFCGAVPATYATLFSRLGITSVWLTFLCSLFTVGVFVACINQYAPFLFDFRKLFIPKKTTLKD